MRCSTSAAARCPDSVGIGKMQAISRLDLPRCGWNRRRGAGQGGLPVVAVPRQARLGALQIGESPDSRAATIDRLMAYRQELEDSRLDVLVLPEALLGGYL